MVKVEDLLRDIETKDLVLPEFQRGYVWKENDVKKFFQSLYKNYPTGSLLIWKTINPPKLRGSQKIQDRGYTRVLLDGQQRLTTLYFLLKSRSPPYYENRDFNFNLWFNIETEEFRYYQRTIMDGQREWISLKKFFEYKEVAEFIDSFPEEEKQRYYFNNKGPLMNISKIKDYNYFVDEEKLNKVNDIKEIVKIFNLVNKQGRTLIEEDLALARISVIWPEIKESFRTQADVFKKASFNFDFNFFVLCINCVLTGHAKFDKILNEDVSIDEIRDIWDRVSRGIEYLINILNSKMYINSDDKYELKSNALLVPIITYLANNKIEFKNEKQLKIFIYWFYQAMIWQRYTRRGKSSPLEQDIVSITKTKDPNSLIDNLKKEVKDFEVRIKNIEGAGIRSPFLNMAFIVAKSMGAVDWFNGNKLHANLLGSRYKLENHHIFPLDVLKKAGYYKNKEDIKLVNEIANRAFLTKKANLVISAKKPSIYLKDVMNRDQKALKQQFVTTKEVLWEEDNYLNFLKDRRKRIADNINNFLSNLIEEEFKSITIEELVKSEESFNLEFKSTFAYDIDKKEVNKELRHSVLKTIIGFMNSGGGTLLVGVSDDNKVVGLKEDYNITQRKDKDGFIQEFVQYIEKAIGINNFKIYIEMTFHKVDNKEVLSINVDKAQRPFYYNLNNNKILYIRDENRTIPMTDPEEIIEYIKNNWD